MQNQSPEKPKRRRWWKWTRRIALVLFCLVGLAASALFVYREVKKARAEKELAAAITELDRADPRWRLEHIEEDRPEIPPAENSIHIAREIFATLGDWRSSDLNIPNQDSTPAWTANQQLTPGHLESIHEALRERESGVAKAASLINFPKGRAKVAWLDVDPFKTPLPHLQESRVVATLLELDIERLLDQKKAADAMRRVRAILNLSDGLQGEPTLLGILVQIAIRKIAIRKLERILALSELGDESLREMQQALHAIAGHVSFAIALRGERAIAHRVFDNLESGKLDLERLADLPGGKPFSAEFEMRLLFFMYMASIKADHALYLRTMTRAFEWNPFPLAVQKAKWEELDQELRSIPFPDMIEHGKMLTRLIFPAVLKIFEAYQRDRALVASATVMLATERFRLARGKWPDRLEQLCPEFLSSIPLDPYDDLPIKFRKDHQAVAIYCIGPDGFDDGGENLNLREKVGSDLGLRLWNRDKRRIPPPKIDDLDELPLKDDR